MENINIILLLNQEKQLNLELLVIVILQYIKMSSANKYMLIGTRIMKNGQNQVLIPRGSGVVGCYGTNQHLKPAMKI